ncbi:hypothetical protein [Oxynema sp. CENA135]|nr:hypothetical protein [Oxynema sp. CENA135]
MKQEVGSKDVHLWVTLGNSYVTDNTVEAGQAIAPIPFRLRSRHC